MKKDITKISKGNRSKYVQRQKVAAVEPILEDQFTSGKLLGKSMARFINYLQSLQMMKKFNSLTD